jgi:hypothetical protein
VGCTHQPEVAAALDADHPIATDTTRAATIDRRELNADPRHTAVILNLRFGP